MRTNQQKRCFAELPKLVVKVSVVAACLVQAGCGSSSPLPIARVTGTVKTQDGELLESGRILFGPIDTDAEGRSGKVASGMIQNGEFVLTTYSRGDGAVIGRHNVSLRESHNMDDELIAEHNLPPKHGCKISPEFAQVEVVSGKNVFEFVAVAKPEDEANAEDD